MSQPASSHHKLKFYFHLNEFLHKLYINSTQISVIYNTKMSILDILSNYLYPSKSFQATYPKDKAFFGRNPEQDQDILYMLFLCPGSI